MSKDNGGPAFPVVAGTGTAYSTTFLGMSLRDYFATAALTGICMSDTFPSSSYATDAETCYRLADAMLAERDK